MITKVDLVDLPSFVQNMSGPPHQLYVETKDTNGSVELIEPTNTPNTTFQELMKRARVAIVGSRKVSAYGEGVTQQFASELAAQGVVIVSGLAIGVDAIAHRAALEVNGTTIAVLPGPVEEIYPRSHWKLARQIVTTGGALISEYPQGTPTFKTNFVARNRIVAAMANVLLITEASEKSGTMHTARFALEQGIDVLAVPGNITSPTSEGTNNLIKAGAFPVTCTNDVLQLLSLPATARTGKAAMRVRGANDEEQRIIDLIEQGITDGNELLNASTFSVERFNHNLTMLEITAKIRSLGANRWALC